MLANRVNHSHSSISSQQNPGLDFKKNRKLYLNLLGIEDKQEELGMGSEL